MVGTGKRPGGQVSMKGMVRGGAEAAVCAAGNPGPYGRGVGALSAMKNLSASVASLNAAREQEQDFSCWSPGAFEFPEQQELACFAECAKAQQHAGLAMTKARKTAMTFLRNTRMTRVANAADYSR